MAPVNVIRPRDFGPAVKLVFVVQILPDFGDPESDPFVDDGDQLQCIRRLFLASVHGFQTFHHGKLLLSASGKSAPNRHYRNICNRSARCVSGVWAHLFAEGTCVKGRDRTFTSCRCVVGIGVLRQTTHLFRLSICVARRELIEKIQWRASCSDLACLSHFCVFRQTMVSADLLGVC